ncbi:MAG: hypothetical protein EOQ65_28975 [Mesorhizobium sp.]|uniref:hypothetical protein n=1 Tax=Mesorhizobium sp. TaxID=1871066 RepID=UPI000FE83AFC|nr:hypothetical protein [Mesorhizobium sp.]RWG54810.1 MAG: hypothetical protein EOQ65_28975 [Mesorhizobium sp.]TIM75838.1 MAG: hypothetical protein E5Y44_13885 [Mesorhizobium sp.]
MFQLRQGIFRWSRLGRRSRLGILALDAGDGIFERTFLLADDLGRQRRRIVREFLRQHLTSILVNPLAQLGRGLAVLRKLFFQNTNEICHASVDLQFFPGPAANQP